MSRPLRIEYPGAVYHITARGDDKRPIYLDDNDRNLFLDRLAGTAQRFEWRFYAYCLMGNHYHLLVETPKPNLARGMRQINGVYTQLFNRRHRRCGHLFQGRYKAILVDGEAYLLELARYIALNPVRAKLAEKAADWPWSSYRATVGLTPAPEWLAAEEILGPLGSERVAARRAYAAFVAEGGGDVVWDGLRNQIFLGDEEFVTRSLEMIQGSASVEAPRGQWRRQPPSLAEIIATASDRNEAIRAAWLTGAYTLAEIGTYFGLHYSRISRIVR